MGRDTYNDIDENNSDDIDKIVLHRIDSYYNDDNDSKNTRPIYKSAPIS